MHYAMQSLEASSTLFCRDGPKVRMETTRHGAVEIKGLFPGLREEANGPTTRLDSGYIARPRQPSWPEPIGRGSKPPSQGTAPCHPIGPAIRRCSRGGGWTHVASVLPAPHRPAHREDCPHLPGRLPKRLDSSGGQGSPSVAFLLAGAA